VLFSEPKIPQSSASASEQRRGRLSVLFSEPKIPQSNGLKILVAACMTFSALQRAENSSIASAQRAEHPPCSLSVLFSEPKIPQYRSGVCVGLALHLFQCSSASRKFLNYPDRAPECRSD